MKTVLLEMKRMHVMKPLIVTDKGIVEAGIIEKAEVYLKNSQIPYAIYDEVFTDPTDELVEKGVYTYKENGCDAIMSIGGGSANRQNIRLCKKYTRTPPF